MELKLIKKDMQKQKKKLLICNWSLKMEIETEHALGEYYEYQW